MASDFEIKCALMAGAAYVSNRLALFGRVFSTRPTF